jgi:hypothetical protein
MDDRVKALARDLGADFVAELPDVGHGALGAAHYAAYYRRRLAEIQRQKVNNNMNPPLSLSVAVDEPTMRALEAITELLWPGENVQVGRFAAALLKGMSALILDQLIDQLETEKHAIKRTLDTKTALLAAFRDLLQNHQNRQAAG